MPELLDLKCVLKNVYIQFKKDKCGPKNLFDSLTNNYSNISATLP